MKSAKIMIALAIMSAVLGVVFAFTHSYDLSRHMIIAGLIEVVLARIDVLEYRITGGDK